MSEIEIPPARLKRISPTALGYFEKDPMRFVLYYVMGRERDKQTHAMAIGSGFDARIKGQIEADLLGKENRWAELFQAQVEPQHRDFVSKHSATILRKYMDCGAYKAFMKVAKNFVGEPRFEFDAEAKLDINGLLCPIYGKPDCFFELPECFVVLDWKVNGFMTSASPAAGYVSLWDEKGHNHGQHKSVTPMRQYGIMVGSGGDMREDWRTQLRIYEMMIDSTDRLPWISGIEQLAFSDGVMRVASHRCVMPKAFCAELLQRIYRCWYHVTTRHYFHEMTKEESDARVREMLSLDDLDLWAMSNG